MRLSSSLFLFLLRISLTYATTRLDFDTHDYYVLDHNPSGGASLHDCTNGLGVEVVRQVGELENHWVVRVQKPSIATREASDPVLERLHALRSTALSGYSKRTPEAANAHRVTNSIRMLEKQELRKRVKRDLALLERQQSEDETHAASRAVAHRLGINDPLFSQQWHIVNDVYPKHMMNVSGVWEMGITGEGVISAVVDDGLDYESDDLAANFDASGSYDFNDHVPLPKPVLWDDHHGTRCAGEISAVKNDVCGVGLAYNSKIAGLRILSGPITDVDESSALNYGFQNTSIYSCSWGPPDDGRSMEGPSLLIQKAVLNGINKGRGGKGSVFVFASGNGAASGDQCNFDGYTNSIYSVTVAAVDNKGLHPYYSEACAANMVVTYSSGSGEHIHTTDVGKNKCADTHGGTSAAAPLGVGVIALALSARPELTWRDVQHICVETATKINPQDPDWEATSTGHFFSYKYGFGLLDAGRYVEAAKTWKLVKPQAWAETDAIELADAAMNETTKSMTGGEMIVKGGVMSTMTVTKSFLEQNNFEKVEHINVRVWITHAKRGDVEVELISPTGVKSVLGGRRKYDVAKTGYPGWTFMTIKHWGESGVGDWTLRVSDQNDPESTGHFLGWSMTLWGESIDPSKAKLYQLPDKLSPLPPHHSMTSTLPPQASTTKTIAKPTHALPADHGTAEGEADKPAFPPQDDAAVPSSTPTVDEGYFVGITDLVRSNTWLFAAGGIVILFAICCGVFLYRRAARRRRAGADYTAVPGEATAMSSMERGSASAGRSKELYDAFGGEEDDEADEHSGLVRHADTRTFADNEDPEHRYRDLPEQPTTSRKGEVEGSEGSTSSWVHATDGRQ